MKNIIITYVDMNTLMIEKVPFYISNIEIFKLNNFGNDVSVTEIAKTVKYKLLHTKTVVVTGSNSVGLIMFANNLESKLINLSLDTEG